MSFLDVFGSIPRPGLHPIPGSKPLTIEAAICPPVLYYLALLFLPPAPPPAIDTTVVKLLRNLLALVAGILFFRLPLAYHVPASIGLTYQLGLVGLYGGARVIDAFFLSPYLFHHIPRRVRYSHVPRIETPYPEKYERDAYFVNESTRVSRETTGANPTDLRQRRKGSAKPEPSSRNFVADLRRGSVPTLNDSYAALSKTWAGPDAQPVTEHALTEDGWPHGFLDRASWALELELSMRGVGFTWTTADVRHTRKTWLPGVSNRLHSIFIHVLPIIAICLTIIRTIYTRYLFGTEAAAWSSDSVTSTSSNPFDALLPLPIQLLLTAALGAFLMVAFSFAHSAFAIACAPLSPSPLAYFPPLYTTRIWSVTSVRGFWSYGWHRLFARFFLVYGVWPGEWIERKLTGKTKEQKADVGKVLGGFLSSAFCHSFAVRGVLGGEWTRASGEAKFFAVNGCVVVLEEGIKRAVRLARQKAGWPESQWYDDWVGRVWWISVLLFSGRNFARGWVNAGLVREMAFL